MTTMTMKEHDDTKTTPVMREEFVRNGSGSKGKRVACQLLLFLILIALQTWRIMSSFLPPTTATSTLCSTSEETLGVTKEQPAKGSSKAEIWSEIFSLEAQLEEAKERLRRVQAANNNKTVVADSTINKHRRPQKDSIIGSVDHSEQNDVITRHQTRIAYITYGHFTKNHEWRFKNMVIDSLETWLQNETYFLVLNQQWKVDLEQQCQLSAHTQACQRVVPLYVNCTEGYYGISPCCKQDQGLSLFWEKYRNDFDWIVYQDDDMYLRRPFLEDFVAGLDSNKPYVLATGHLKPLGVVWGDKQNRENCSRSSKDHLYPWGQPVIYSRAALRLLVKGFKAGAVEKQCREYRVTHDVGNAIVHFMYGLTVVMLPSIPHFTIGKSAIVDGKLQSAILGVHKAGIPEHETDMSILHEELFNTTYPSPPYKYEYHQARGFRATKTFRSHGDPSGWGETWHTMSAAECRRMDEDNPNATCITYCY